MLKKTNLLKLLSLLLFSGMLFGVEGVLAIDISFGGLGDMFGENGDIGNKITHVHFVDNGNDFGGMFLFSNDTLSSDASASDDGEGNGGGGEPAEEGSEIATEEVEAKNVGEVSIGGTSYTCEWQLKGFYYNSERGERLWPLDEDTNDNWFQRKDDNIGFTGGFYFGCWEDGGSVNTCESDDNSDNPQDGKSEEPETPEGTTDEDCLKPKKIYHPGIYGMTSYEYAGQKFSLMAGVEYETGGQWITMDEKSSLAPTFDILNNEGKQYPLGFVYDTNGGIGFAGCEFTGGKASGLQTLVNAVMEEPEEHTDDGYVSKLDSLFVFQKSEDGKDYPVLTGFDGVNLDCKNIGAGPSALLSLIVDGLIGMGRDSNYDTIASVEKLEKMQFFSSVNLNNGVLINYAKKKSEMLCRGRWVNNVSDAIAKAGDNHVVCINFDKLGDDNSVEASAKILKGMTLVVKNGNVKVEPGTDYQYDIFIDKGWLIIDSGEGVLVFDKSGFPSNTAVSDFNENVSKDATGYDGSDVAVGKLLKGNFIVNGLVKPSGGKIAFSDKYFVHGKFTSLNSFDHMSESQVASLKKLLGINYLDAYTAFGDLFKWRCINYAGSEDGNACPHNNEYYKSPFVVIERNFSSPLFN